MTGQDSRLAARVVLALAIGVLAISFAAIFFRKAAPTHPIVAAGLRLVIACALLTPLALRSRAPARRRIARAGAAGGIFYGLHFGAWVTSLNLTSVASSVTLVTATPLLLGVIGVLRGRDAPTRRLWGALLLALVGVLLIGGGDLALGPKALLGDALALVGAAAMAGYLLLARSLRDAMDVWVFTATATGVGALTMLALALALGVPFEPASAEALGWLALAAVLPQVVGHSLLTWSLRHTTPTVVGIATVGEPVGSAFLGWVWLGEAVGPVVGLGCGVTLAAVVLALRA